MLNSNIRPTTIIGIKRLATRIKKSESIPHHMALELASRSANFQNYAHACHVLSQEASAGRARNLLFLSCYWRDRDTYEEGRETVTVELSKPIVEICSKSEMKITRGLASMRLAATDYLVRDELGQSQSFARFHLCQCVRVLQFLDATGLRPCTNWVSQKAEQLLDGTLPNSDHATNWYDPATGQFIITDEPYSDPVVSDERAEWADRNQWYLKAAAWPGMYNPPRCSLFVATSTTSRFDFNALMAKINALPEPVIPESWTGMSVDNHDAFVSPMARTPQDRRRAKAKGTVQAVPSRSTIPFQRYWGQAPRKPNGVMPIAEHLEAGRMIKAVLGSEHKPWSVNRRMDSVRNRLEDWLSYELPTNFRNSFDVVEVYFDGIPSDDPFVSEAKSPDGVIRMLNALKGKLASFYPDCAPTRSLMGKIDTALRHTQRMIKSPTQ